MFGEIAQKIRNYFTGDVSGRANNLTVTGLQNVTLASTSPVTGQALVKAASSWGPGNAIVCGQFVSSTTLPNQTIQTFYGTAANLPTNTPAYVLGWETDTTRLYISNGDGTWTFIGGTLVDNSITYAKIQQESANTLLGNPTGSTANVSEVSLASSLAFDASNKLTVSQAVQNLLTNGGFEFFQRTTPTSNTIIANDKYGPDRWRMCSQSASLQVSRSSATGITNLTSGHYAQFTQITNAGKFLICQPLEEFTTQSALGPVTFQVWMKASSAKTIKIAILSISGIADSIPGTFVSAWNSNTVDPTFTTGIAAYSTVKSCSVTTTFQSFSVTVNTALSATNNIGVAVWTDSQFSSTESLYLAQAGLYPITSAPAVWTPRHKGDDLASCRRFYEKSYDLDTVPGTATTTSMQLGFALDTAGDLYCPIRYRSAKRNASSTITVYSANSGASGKIYDVGQGDNTASVVNNGQDGFMINANRASGIGYYQYCHWTSENEM